MTLSGTKDTTDRIWGAALALVIAALAVICASGEPSPAIWEELAVAAGARPALVSTHSLWMAFSSMLLRYVPGGHTILWLLGPLTLGLFAYLFAGLVQMLLPPFLRLQLAEVKSHTLIRRFVILPVAALFCLSEPVWRLGLYFTPDTFHVLLAFLGGYGIVRFLRTGSNRFAMLAYFVLGLLTAEEPVGLALLVIASAAMTRFAFAVKNSGGAMATTQATLFAFVMRLLTVLALVALVIALAVTGWFFTTNGGSAASEVKEHQVIIDFFLAYFRRATDMATPGGWMYFVGLGLLPLAVSSVAANRATDIEKILDYRVALAYIGTAALTFLQLANFPIFWLWQRNTDVDAVQSSVLLVITMVCCALSLAACLEVLLVEVFFRHYERFAHALFSDASEEFMKALKSRIKRGALRVTWVIANSIPYALVILSLVWRPNFTECGMFRCVGDFVRLLADDCRGSSAAITDGSADAALELEMFRRGEKDFKALSMLGDRSPRETFLRRRGETNGTEDWIALGISTAGTLRDWVHTGSDRATNLTVQIGFELWRQAKLTLPPMGATSARTDGIPEAVRTNLVAQAHALGERMLTFAKRGAPNVTSDAALRRMWNFALWRLARAARMRADEADRRGDIELAKSETDFADRLDDVNLAYQEVRKRTEWVPRQIKTRFTPREGLKFALRQADFTLASNYARQILAKDGDDFGANFAMGMYYVTAEQYARALHHLELAHKARPKEPAALNNLASVEMYLGRLDLALQHAEEALKLAPEVAEIRRTVQEVRHAIEKNERGQNISH